MKTYLIEPKSLDVEAVFKSNDRKELRNWVEGISLL
jgi:hypothetical protein